MEEKVFECESGGIHYWTNYIDKNYLYTLVFLPGIGCDHNVFAEQIAFFEKKYNIITWDAPGHGKSEDFKLDFSIFDLARWLRRIMEIENIKNPILIGHSIGGYIAQAYYELFPECIEGMAILDAGPLKKGYLSSWEVKLFKNIHRLLKFVPWFLLKHHGPYMIAATKAGRLKTGEIFNKNVKNRAAYIKLVGHCHSILVDATLEKVDYAIDCPLLVMCGDKDLKSCIRQSELWNRKDNFRLEFVRNAGHYSFVDNPHRVNELIYKALTRLKYYKTWEMDYFLSRGHDL